MSDPTAADVLAVACPACGAKAGDPCRNSRGHRRKRHTVRVGAARESARLVAALRSLPVIAQAVTAEERAALEGAADDAEARRMLTALGLPVEPLLAVRRILAAGGVARGVVSNESDGQTDRDHVDHAEWHLVESAVLGYNAMADGNVPVSHGSRDPDSGELSVDHAAARCLLAGLVVRRG